MVVFARTLLKRKENLAVGLLFEIEMAPVAANMGYSRGREPCTPIA
jgi:hypothetical protein